MADIPILVVARATQKALKVLLDADPPRFVWIPKSQLTQEYEAGERNLCVTVKDGWWLREWSQDEWRREMKR